MTLHPQLKLSSSRVLKNNISAIFHLKKKKLSLEKTSCKENSLHGVSIVTAFAVL